MFLKVLYIVLYMFFNRKYQNCKYKYQFANWSFFTTQKLKPQKLFTTIYLMILELVYKKKFFKK